MNLPPFTQGANLTLAELTYYQHLSRLWQPPARSLWSSINGQHASKARGHGIHLESLRLYQSGDDIRAIDWRLMARTGKAHTKIHQEDREQPVWLIVDFGDSMRSGTTLLLKSIQAAHFAALVAWLALSAKDRVGIMVSNGIEIKEIKPTSGANSAMAGFNALVTSHTQAKLGSHKAPQQNNQLIEAITRLLDRQVRGADIIVISDFYLDLPSIYSPLRTLNIKNRLKFVKIYDPIEQGEIHTRGHLWLQNFHQSKKVRLNPRLSASLNEQFTQHATLLAQFATSLRTPLYTLSAARPLKEQIGYFYG